MLRMARPLLGSSRALALRRGPVCPPRAFGPLTLPPQTPRHSQKLASVPVVWRTEYSSKPPVQPTARDKAREAEVGKQKLEAHPEHVSAESTVRHAFEGAPSSTGGQDIRAGVRSDLVWPGQPL